MFFILMMMMMMLMIHDVVVVVAGAVMMRDQKSETRGVKYEAPSIWMVPLDPRHTPIPPLEEEIRGLRTLSQGEYYYYESNRLLLTLSPPKSS